MENLGLFEKYLDGSLSETERKDFLKRLSEDPEFKQQFRTYNEIDNLIKKNKKRQEFKATLKEVADNYFKSRDDSINKENNINKKTNNYRLLFKVAASITIIIALGITAYFVFNSHPTNKELYAENYTPLKIDFITRSTNDSAGNLKRAFIMYQTRDFNKCLQILSSEKIPDSLRTSVIIIQGLSNMELGDFKKAELLLKEASADENNILHNDCLWYLSLTYLNLDQPEKCIPLLKTIIKRQSEYTEKARNILLEIE